MGVLIRAIVFTFLCSFYYVKGDMEECADAFLETKANCGKHTKEKEHCPALWCIINAAEPFCHEDESQIIKGWLEKNFGFDEQCQDQCNPAKIESCPVPSNPEEMCIAAKCTYDYIKSCSEEKILQYSDGVTLEQMRQTMELVCKQNEESGGSKPGTGKPSGGGSQTIKYGCNVNALGSCPIPNNRNDLQSSDMCTYMQCQMQNIGGCSQDVLRRYQIESTEALELSVEMICQQSTGGAAGPAGETCNMGGLANCNTNDPCGSMSCVYQNLAGCTDDSFVKLTKGVTKEMMKGQIDIICKNTK